MSHSTEAQQNVHEAVSGLLAEGEIAICWVLTIDVAGPNGNRYLAHRAGGGIDGTDGPMAWTALGMLEASAATARNQLADHTVTVEDEDDEDDEDES